jgi:predicted RNA-binding Zn-ribbon protein involved in translation (DUF1610 family)
MDRVELLDHVELRLHTDDPVLAALVREYWAIDQDGKWSFAVKSLADRYGLAASEVTATVRRVSEARARHVSCPTCGEGVVVRGRADYLQVHRSRAVECRACVQARWKQDQAARQFPAFRS